MAILLFFAFVAGIVTILSPCILPILPVVLSGSVGGGKARPLGIITGFVASFSFFTLTLSAIVKVLNIDPNIMRYVAAGMILAFGLIMVIPPLKNAFMRLVSGLSSRAGGGAQPGTGGSRGYVSGLVLGLSLGLVWSPCVGPIMGSIIALAVNSSVDLGAVFITLAYALGTAIPLFLIMLGGRGLLQRIPFLTRNVKKIQIVFGGLMIVTAVALFTGADRLFQTFILQVFPSYGAGLTSIENQGAVLNAISARDQGASAVPVDDKGDGSPPAVDMNIQSPLFTTFAMGGPWINSPALTPADLKGKVVLVDFWTYSCVNCIRTFPYLKAWYEKYKDRGLVIVGVHTPEFPFERNTANVSRAAAQSGLSYPIVQDNDYKIWNAFRNRYWPAHYLFDRMGVLRYRHFGEGEYDATEFTIRKFLGEKSGPLASDSIAPTQSTTAGLTPETYLGYERTKRFSSPEAGAYDRAATYSFPPALSSGQWAIEGNWVQGGRELRAAGPGTIELSFHAKSVYLVLGPVEGSPPPLLTVTVNGRPTGTADVKDGKLHIGEYRLYTLYDGSAPIDGTVKIETPGPLAAYAFTFG
ncbi:MAG: cytochrome c biogenesis protein DipZ [Spirochaetales bacterium]|nr:cytochrome c biogenesis protein DipZ [Spirochaetales bacterium]